MRSIAKAFAITMVLLLAAMMIKAQSQSSAPTVPQWQIDAGGKMAFDVTSVKPNKNRPPSFTPHSNVPLDDGDGYPPNGGLFSASEWPLPFYIRFAYKISESGYSFILSQMPEWAIHTDWFDIEAHAPISNPTKDQMRLMMQSLLSDRFKLAVHWDTRQLPVLALVLVKPGKLGPQLKVHTSDSPCPRPGSSPAPALGSSTDSSGPCDLFIERLTAGQDHLKIVDETMASIAGKLTGGNTNYIDRMVVDQTGLEGRFDFSIDYAPDKSLERYFPDFKPDPSGPTIIEALQEQTGLKLVRTTGPVDVLVIDHIEEPSPN